MKAKLIVIIFLLLTDISLTLAQDQLQFGLRSNIGVFGAKYPKGYELRDDTLRRTDGFFQHPNLAFSGEALMEYSFITFGDWSMAIQLGIGYNYTSFRKEWHFKFNYDSDFTNYGSEQQIIHELKAHYLTVPLRGSLKFRKLKGSLGLVGTRVFFASIDRTSKRRSGTPLDEWIVEKSHYRAFKKEKESIDTYTPYLSHYYGVQGTISLEYQLMKNIFFGLEARRIYYAPSIHVYTAVDEIGTFHNRGNMISLSLLFIR